MPSFHAFRPEHFCQQTLKSNTTSLESYTTTNMENNYYTTAYNNNFPFMFADASALETTVAENLKYDMVRSLSGTSMQQPYEYPPPLLSSSTSSSTVGSPYSGPSNMIPAAETYPISQPFSQPIFYNTSEHGSVDDLSFMEHDAANCAIVDPSLYLDPRDHHAFAPQQFANDTLYPQQPYTHSTAPSPSPSHLSYSPFNQYIPGDNYLRFQRGESVVSRKSGCSPASSCTDEEGVQKGCCPYPECGKPFKDLKAHMLTHQSERPEKCPIVNCEYHTKGFSRKYDKNRHVLTHYRGTMVCGFCPNSGSPQEKTFNRADVFKRHLMSMHHVEQNPPNSRKRSPANSNQKLSSYCEDATGKCSTCSRDFTNAQEFYEHLDECVLRVVQQEEPSEAINARRLAEVATDPAVQETFDRHMIKQEDIPYNIENDDDEEDEEDEDEDENEMYGKSTLKSSKIGSRAVIGGGVAKSKSSKKSMTWSKIGVALTGKGRKRRKHYPASWGMSADKMKMRKRVLCVYDGSHRLVKDDMMLNDDYEVRLTLADGHSWVTDLDVETIKRADAFHDACPEEKIPWIPEQDLFTEFGP